MSFSCFYSSFFYKYFISVVDSYFTRTCFIISIWISVIYFISHYKHAWRQRNDCALQVAVRDHVVSFSSLFFRFNSNMLRVLYQHRWCCWFSRDWQAIKKKVKLSAPSFWLSHPKLPWLMWKVCAEPTTSAGVGLWNSNSHEERPTSPVTPNPTAPMAHSLFTISLFHSVHHLRMLSCKQSRRRRGLQATLCEWWESS